jgi:cytochrome b subunit of formate dehydrogenase
MKQLKQQEFVNKMNKLHSGMSVKELKKINPSDYEYYLNKHNNEGKHHSSAAKQGDDDDSASFVLSVIFLVLSYIVGLIIFACTAKSMTPAHRKTCNILAIVFGVIYCIVIIIGFL